jgi:hypothetical protein
VQEADVALKKLSDHFAQFLSRRDEVVAEARYLDETGKVLVSATAHGVKPSTARYANAPFFQRAKSLSPDSGVLTSVEQSESLRIAVLRLVLPIYNDWKEFRGVMVVDLPMSYFTSTLAGALTGRPGTSFLVDGSGTILGPTGSAETLAERWRGPGELSEILRTPPGDPQIVDLAGGGHGLLVREVVGAHGWTVGVLAPLAEIEAPVRVLTQSTLAYGSAGAIVLVLAVVMVARGASRRVRRLQAATAQLAKGHFGLHARRGLRRGRGPRPLVQPHGGVPGAPGRRAGRADRGSTAPAPGAGGPQRGHPGRPYLAGPAREPRGHPRSPDGALRLHGGCDPAAREGATTDPRMRSQAAAGRPPARTRARGRR